MEAELIIIIIIIIIIIHARVNDYWYSSSC